MTDEWMTTQEAANYLNVTQRTINNLINRRTLSAQKFGIQWMITRESVEAYKAQQDNKPKK